jgi:hypothetical protein
MTALSGADEVARSVNTFVEDAPAGIRRVAIVARQDPIKTMLCALSLSIP